MSVFCKKILAVKEAISWESTEQCGSVRGFSVWFVCSPEEEILSVCPFSKPVSVSFNKGHHQQQQQPTSTANGNHQWFELVGKQ